MDGVVTILFTDLVGSTELTDRLGDERASALRRAHFRLLEETVERHGGTVVKNVGDGLMVVFPSAVDASTCAVAMQRGVAARNRTDEVALGMRVGLHVGEPEREDDDFFGTPVNVASRLCDAAAGGQIVASDVVRAIVGSRGGVRFRELGSITLKGVEGPVGAGEIVWESSSVPLPLPPRVDRARTALVGRDEERQRLRRSLDAARQHRGSLVLVAGEPGVGKTRLVVEFAREAHHAGSPVLYGRCGEEPLLPYQPFVEALGHLAAQRPDEVRSTAPDLARLLPGLAAGSDPTSGDPETQRYRLFHDVAAILAAEGRAAPVVLILDDLHWADATTLTMLRHVVGGAANAPVLVVGTYRDVELGRRHPLAEVLADLRRDGVAERLRLHGLSRPDVERLLAELAGHELDQHGRALAAALHTETGGNPYFVREIVRHLVETGTVYTEDGRWTSHLTVADVGLPESVREVIGRRLNRVGDACGDVLRVAAVLGRDFELPVLARLAERDEDALADLLEEALGAGGLVTETPEVLGRYSFAHALVRETLYGELSTNRRVRLHRRAGEAIEQVHAGALDDRLGQLAHHFHEAAAAGTTAKAIDYARRAGDRARHQLAFEEAVGSYERALSAFRLADVDDPELHSELLLELGEARRLAADLEGAREACEAAAEIAQAHGWGERLARAALTHGGLWVDIRPDREEGLALLRSAVELLPDDHPLVPQVHGRLAMELFGLPEHADEMATYSHRAVEGARRLGDPRTLAYALIARRHARSGPGDLDERLAITDEAITVARSVGDLELELRTRAFRQIDDLEAADIAAVDEGLEVYFDLAAQTRRPFYTEYHVALVRATSHLREGRLDEVEALVPALAEHARRQGRMTALVATATQRIELRYLRGVPEPADGEDARIWSLFAGAHPSRAPIGAWLEVRLGRLDEARRWVDRFLEHGWSALPHDWLHLGAFGALAEVCEATGDRELAAEVAERALPFRDRVVCVAGTGLVAVRGTVADVLGLCAHVLGRPDEAVAHHEAGLKLNRRIRAWPYAVQSRVKLARALGLRAAPGDLQRARELLDEALAEARRLGLAAPFVAEARALRAADATTGQGEHPAP